MAAPRDGSANVMYNKRPMRFFHFKKRTGHNPYNIVYVWPTSRGYLAEKVVSQRLDIPADPADSADRISARLPDNVRTFLFHVDITDTSRYPLERARVLEMLRARSIRVLNEHATDISKRTIHALSLRLGLPCTLAVREGNPDELMLVKTNRNFGGQTERLLPRKHRRTLGLQNESSTVKGAFNYRLLPRAQVPESWWDASDLVVERYIAHPARRLHRVSIAMDRFVFWSGIPARPIAKMRHCTDAREHLLRRGDSHPELPDALLQTAYRFAEAFQLEYGSLDLMSDDTGCHYVIDANTTPYCSTASERRITFLRAGFDAGPG